MTEPQWPSADWSAEPWAHVAETHSAVVFFAGDRACKLKKPVSLGFLDFSTPQARAVACARETELNLRFAPDVYLGVAEIRGPDGRVCDHLVVMRRMPAARRLSALVRSGAPVAVPLRRVARILAAQHATAARGPEVAEQGSRDALHRRWADNIGQTRQTQELLAPRQPLEPAAIDETEQLALRFLAGRAPLFDARIRDGRIVDGHGDLLADDIFCLDDGPRILDCLDFDDRLRWLDGLDDAAFLAMDLERLGVPALAEQFMARYAEYSGDPAPVSLCHHYLAYRAFVRVKVACLRVVQDLSAAGRTACCTAPRSCWPTVSRSSSTRPSSRRGTGSRRRQRLPVSARTSCSCVAPPPLGWPPGGSAPGPAGSPTRIRRSPARWKPWRTRGRTPR
jgi:uncharacterized protein